MNPTPLILGIVLFVAIGMTGCIDPGTIGSPLLGVWETKVLGFDQTVRFESNGTGVLVTTLGQRAFEFQTVDSDTLRIRYEGQEDWEEKSYALVSNNTLQLEGLTWVRQGTV